MDEFYELLADHDGDIWDAVTEVIQRAGEAQEPGVPYDWSRARMRLRSARDGVPRVVLEVPYV